MVSVFNMTCTVPERLNQKMARTKPSHWMKISPMSKKSLPLEQAYGEAQDEIERLTSSGDRFDYAVALAAEL